jgi:hypothetical protein
MNHIIITVIEPHYLNTQRVGVQGFAGQAGPQGLTGAGVQGVQGLIGSQGISGSTVEGVFNQTETSYTLGISDISKVVRLSNSSSISVIVPTNTTASIPVGSVIHICQTGYGVITINREDVTVNLYNYCGLKTGGMFWYISLVKVGLNEWDVIGGTL